MSVSPTLPTGWRKSSYSGARDQNCVEVADLPSVAAVRDTQNREAGYLTVPTAEWSALLGAIRR